MVDRIDLNSQMGRVPLSDTTEGRAETVRLACLQAAVAGSASGWNDQTVIKRAAAFEAFVLRGAEPKAGQTHAWTGEEIQQRALEQAAAQLRNAPAAESL